MLVVRGFLWLANSIFTRLPSHRIRLFALYLSTVWIALIISSKFYLQDILHRCYFHKRSRSLFNDVSWQLMLSSLPSLMIVSHFHFLTFTIILFISLLGLFALINALVPHRDKLHRLLLIDLLLLAALLIILVRAHLILKTV